MKTLAAILMLICMGVVQADDAKQIFISISHTGEDDVGKQLIYRLKEEIRKSILLELDERLSGIRLQFITLDIGKEKNVRSAYSMTLVVKDFRTGQWVYVTSTIGDVGRERVENAAAALVADVAEDAEAALADQILWLKTPLNYKP